MGEDHGRFWRVYRTEWTVAYVSDQDGETGVLECRSVFDSRLSGLVEDGKWRIVPWSVRDSEAWPWQLELLIPVMKGEFLSRGKAVAMEFLTTGPGMVVQEGTRKDQEFIRRGRDLLLKVR